MRIIAVDPGYGRMGVAVLEEKNRKPILLFSKCLTTPVGEFSSRLNQLVKNFSQLLGKWQPEALAIEKLYFTKNQKTAMRVAEVRGAIVAAAAGKELSIFEYTPLEVKVAVTGYGRADKKQVAQMVPRLLDLKRAIKSDDELDAIAVGLTALASYRQS